MYGHVSATGIQCGTDFRCLRGAVGQPWCRRLRMNDGAANVRQPGALQGHARTGRPPGVACGHLFTAPGVVAPQKRQAGGGGKAPRRAVTQRRAGTVTEGVSECRAHAARRQHFVKTAVSSDRTGEHVEDVRGSHVGWLRLQAAHSGTNS